MQMGGRLPSTLGLIGNAYIRTYNNVYLLMMGPKTFGLTTHTKTQFDALLVETKRLVTKWWTMETTTSLNCKKVFEKRIGVKQFVEHPAQFLQVS